MIILVPSYEPGPALVRLVTELRRDAPRTGILVVDDGSGEAYSAVFDAAADAGATVIGYPTNRGKGYALKKGIRHVLDHHAGHDLVTADGDGQHTVADILRVADRLRVCAADGEAAARGHVGSGSPRSRSGGGGSSRGGAAAQGAGSAAGGVSSGRGVSGRALVVGGRRFAGDVPARSRFGNAVSRGVFRVTTGVALHDTQSGLRGLPSEMLPWLVSVRGERFEYELNVLIDSVEAGYRIDELAIETVYVDDNTSSHFRPVFDSVRVLRPFLRFASASAASFVVDLVLLQLFVGLGASLLAAVVGARAVSATVNFLLNRHLVFRSADARGGPASARIEALRYVALATVMLAASYGFQEGLATTGLPVLPAKLVTDVALYAIGFVVQRRFVFTGDGMPVGPADDADAAVTRAAAPARVTAGTVSRSLR